MQLILLLIVHGPMYVVGLGGINNFNYDYCVKFNIRYYRNTSS